MGSRGPAPMPAKLKLLHGETRPSRVNRREPKGAGRPVMPPDMSDGAKAVWRHVMRTYGSTNIITDTDRDVLRMYCEAADRYTVAARMLADSGPLVRGARRGELVKSPLHQVVRDNATLVRTLARELGLTPSARAGLKVPEVPADDALEKWLASG